MQGPFSRLLLKHCLADLLYSFGIANPGAITLRYPDFLRQLKKRDEPLMDMAAVDIMRDRERGVPRYNRFRELIGRGRVDSFEEVTSIPSMAQRLRQVYKGRIDDVDLLVGLLSEDPPKGFGFSDTAFRVFILMASRRLKSDRFFTVEYRREIYTPLGMEVGGQQLDKIGCPAAYSPARPRLGRDREALRALERAWAKISGPSRPPTNLPCARPSALPSMDRCGRSAMSDG